MRSMDNGSAYEDVVFAALLGVWSIKVEGLWQNPTSFRRPLLFLLAAAMIAVVLRLLWEVPGPGWRLFGYGWAVIAFAAMAYTGVQTAIFSATEGWIFWLVLILWGLTAIVADWAGRLVRRALGV